MSALLISSAGTHARRHGAGDAEGSHALGERSVLSSYYGGLKQPKGRLCFMPAAGAYASSVLDLFREIGFQELREALGSTGGGERGVSKE